MRLRCVIDANVLIDLSHGAILPLLFELPLEVLAPDAVLDELTEPDRETLLEMGLNRADMTLEQLAEIRQLSAQDQRLSLGDFAAFVSARDEGALLLTGDGRLRDHAAAAGLTVHGVLWVLDEVERANLLGGPALAASLRKMLDEGARLPADACERRLKRWAKK